MPKKVRFKPTKHGKKDLKTKKKLAELFRSAEESKINTIEVNSNGNFAPKFVVGPDMKDNFALVKVQNHKLVKEDNEVKATVTMPKIPATTVATTKAPQNLISRKPLRTRGRLVKKIKARGQMANGVLKNMKDHTSRKRLQFIKRGKSVPRAGSRSRSRGNELPVVKKKLERKALREPRVSVTVSTSVSDGTKIISNTGARPVPNVPDAEEEDTAETRQKEEEANRRVAELTSNILELKAKLEQLRLELHV